MKHGRTVVCPALLAAVLAAGLPALPAAAAASDGITRISTRTAAYKDSAGKVWEAERGFTGGRRVTATKAAIGATDDDALYQTERRGVRAFSAPVAAPGVYNVTLLLSENRHARKGLRRFTVAAEGRPVLRDLDIFARSARDNAHKVTVAVPVKDGRLDLAFSASAGQAEVSGITIAPMSTVTTAARVKPAPTPKPTASPTPAPAPADGVQRISTRTTSYTDRAGKVWAASRGFVGGTQTNVTTAPIGGTEDDPLYQSERWGMTGFSTAVPAAGTYTVTLKFAENFYTRAGLRSFSVAAEGSPVVNGLDLYATVGKDVAYDVSVPVAVTDGTLNLAFAATIDSAKVSAISVAPAGTSTAPSPTPTPTPTPTALPTSNGSGLPWASGASGNGISDGTFATWRGRPVDIAGTWVDNNTAQVELWSLQSYGEYSASKWQKDIDIAVGAIGAGETWSQAAQGAYDARWRQSLTNLKSVWGARPGTVYVRFAHEMNGNWYPWSVNTTNATDFVTSWKRYRALQQEIFPQSKLVFSVNRESVSMGMDWRRIFPGSAFVDVMSVDYYNHYPWVNTTTDWNASILQSDVYGAPKGLQRHLDFARSVGLPLAVSEWANNADFGDSGLFMRNMFGFFSANAGTGPGQVIYDVQFNVDTEQQRWLVFPTTRQASAAAAYRDTW